MKSPTETLKKWAALPRNSPRVEANGGTRSFEMGLKPRFPGKLPRLGMIAGGVCLVAPCVAIAQAYPSKPIRVIVPFTAGSVADMVPRLVGEKIPAALGQPFVVENRIGAGGRIGAEAVAKSAPDGYTLVIGSTSTLVISPYLVKNIPYDPVKDFTPIINAATPITGFVTSASVPVNSMREFFDYAKKNPGKLAFGSMGIGSAHHLRGEQIKIVAAIDMLHVPFAGANEIVTGILTDTVQLSFSTPSQVLPHVPAGKMKLLGLTTPKRVASLPTVPTLEETLPAFESTMDWFGILGPANLPRPVVMRLNAEIMRIIESPDVKGKFESQGMVTLAGSPEEFAALMRRDYALYARLTKAVGLLPQ